MHMQNRRKGQAAMDFLLSYGMAILIISIALYVAVQLGAYNPNLAPQSCATIAGYACVAESLGTNGTLNVVLAQATGGTLNITGAACSSGVNASGDAPQFGNIHLLSDTGNTLRYPNTNLYGGYLAYSNSPFSIGVYCYSSSGMATGPLGSSFTGYLWLNYSFSGLPNGVHYITQVATFNVKYT